MKCIILATMFCLSTAGQLEAQDAPGRLPFVWELPSLQEVPEPPELVPGRDRIDHVAEGATAPYEGMLLDMATALRWGAVLEWWPRTFEMRLEHIREEVLKPLVASHEINLGIVENSWRRINQDLRRDMRTMAGEFNVRLAEALDEEFYETWTFAFVTGVAAAVIVGAVTIWGINSAQ